MIEFDILLRDFLFFSQFVHISFQGSGVIQSLATHPTNDDILFANKREFQLWSIPTELPDFG